MVPPLKKAVGAKERTEKLASFFRTLWRPQAAVDEASTL
jgi:hypothetical protein